MPFVHTDRDPIVYRAVQEPLYISPHGRVAGDECRAYNSVIVALTTSGSRPPNIGAISSVRPWDSFAR